MTQFIPLLSLTSTPILYSTFSFGGDDVLGFCENVLPEDHELIQQLANIRSKYYDNRDNPIFEEYETCRTNIINATKAKISTPDTTQVKAQLQKLKDIFNDEEKHKSLKEKIITYAQNMIDNNTDLNRLLFSQSVNELQEIGQNIGTITRSIMTPSITSNSSRLDNLEAGIKTNEAKRLQLVEALGGKEFCKNIPVITVEHIYDYMHFNMNEIPEDQTIVQYEDKAGRKGIIFKVRNKTSNNISIMWIGQRYRETCISPYNEGGGLWTMHGNEVMGINKIIAFLEDPGDYELLFKEELH